MFIFTGVGGPNNSMPLKVTMPMINPKSNFPLEIYIEFSLYFAILNIKMIIPMIMADSNNFVNARPEGVFMEIPSLLMEKRWTPVRATDAVKNENVISRNFSFLFSNKVKYTNAQIRIMDTWAIINRGGGIFDAKVIFVKNMINPMSKNKSEYKNWMNIFFKITSFVCLSFLMLQREYFRPSQYFGFV